MIAIKFTVPGTPAPQGSKRHVGNGRLIESSQHLGTWRQRIAYTALSARQHQPPSARFDKTAAVVARIEFVMPRPQSTPKTRTPAATKRPDIDKLARAVLDAITGVVIHDDAQIVALYATKRLAERDENPCANITIEALT
jgi:crossover junction endodeoxyribonuclease RusA